MRKHQTAFLSFLIVPVLVIMNRNGKVYNDLFLTKLINSTDNRIHIQILPLTKLRNIFFVFYLILTT